MQVRATQTGYFEHSIRKEGDVFHLSDEKQFSHEWMEAVGWTPPAKVKPQVSQDNPPSESTEPKAKAKGKSKTKEGEDSQGESTEPKANDSKPTGDADVI